MSKDKNKENEDIIEVTPIVLGREMCVELTTPEGHEIIRTVEPWFVSEGEEEIIVKFRKLT